MENFKMLQKKITAVEKLSGSYLNRAAEGCTLSLRRTVDLILRVSTVTDSITALAALDAETIVTPKATI